MVLALAIAAPTLAPLDLDFSKVEIKTTSLHSAAFR
jgi:hypothetical protein